MDNSCKTEACIRCSVKSCVHHTMNDSCNAGSIKVGNSNACCCSETCCDTFEAKK